MLRRAQAARLLAVDREVAGTRLLLLKRDEASVGSAEGSGLRVADASVADRHAIIRYARGRYYVVDLKSAEGTFLNGRRIRRTQALKHGDTVRFGGATPYRFIDPDALKRRRWRRILRVSPVVAVLVAVGLADHFEKWGLLSATLTEIAALAHQQATSKPVAAPTIVAANAPTRLAAPSAQVTSMPGPAAYVANVAPTARPMAVSTPKLPVSAPTSNLPASSSMTWLERINFYRAALGLDPIRNNPDLSAAAAAHARYLLLNFGEDLRSAKPMSGDAYEEKPGNRGYSASGAAAARNLQFAWGCSSYEVAQQIDRWIEGPFHRFAVFDPDLTEAGYGEADSEGCWVAALRLPQPPPEEEKPYPRAIEFPPDRADVALDWIGLEAPDPLESCPGYSRPVGLPITLQIGRLVDTKLTAHSLTEDGKPIEHCAFDADSYRNHIKSLQTFGHWNLRDAGAVVIVPRSPLRAGSHYSVSITAAGNSYAWSFKVADVTTFAAIAKLPASPSAAPPIAEPTNAPSFSPPPPAIERDTRRATPAPEAMTSTSAPEEYAAARPTSKPTPEASPAAVGSSTNWLTVLNRYRTRLNVPPVEEDPSLSSGCLAHAKYLMRNYGGKFQNIGILMHQENQSKPGYSPEGLKAARASDVIFQPRNKMTDDHLMGQAIEWWISGPFHRGQLINSELRRVGFAQYCDRALCVSALNTTSDAPLASISGRLFAAPIEVPPDGATVKTPGFGAEWPNPVASCSGYSTKSPAITLNLGVNVPARITDAHLTQTTGAAAGTIVDTCAYDSDSYTNPNAGDQERARQVLRAFGQVVMMVRDPLSPGESYRVAMTVNGTPYTWSFTAAP
jgi:uncharacterized protein YkwD